MFINGLYLLLYYRTLLMEAKLHLMPTLSYTHRIKDRCSTNTLTHSKSYQNMHIMQNALYKSSKKKSTINKFTELQNSIPLNVQQLCFDSNKWLIIDQQTYSNIQTDAPIKKVKKNKENRKVINANKKSRVVTTKLLQTALEKQTNSQLFNNINQIKTNYSRVVNLTQIAAANHQEEIKSPKRTINKRYCQLKVQFDAEEKNRRVKKLKTKQREESSPCKSMKSCKTTKSVKSTTKSIKKLASPNKQKTCKQQIVQNKQNVSIIDLKLQDKIQQYSMFETARLYDSTSYINPTYLGRRLTPNFYEEQPEWLNQIVLQTALNRRQSQIFSDESQKNNGIVDNNKNKQIPFEKIEVKSMPLQNKIENQLLNINEGILAVQNYQNLIINNIQNPVQINQRNESQFQMQIQQNHKITESQKCKQLTTLQHESEQDYKNSLTTKASQKVAQSSLNFTSRKQCDKQAQMTTCQNRITHTLNSVYVDNSYDMTKQFMNYPMIRLISIPPNRQTALFPSKPQKYPITQTSPLSLVHSTFSNSQIINFLNFLLQTNSSIISSCLQVPSASGYVCNLFNGSHFQRITIDGIFPFDINYYPLFGCIQQYIWLSVLIKSIAKMKGSYRSISSITFQQLFTILTGHQLIKHPTELVSADNPIRSLKMMIKSASLHGHILVAVSEQSFYQIDKVINRNQIKLQKDKRNLGRDTKTTNPGESSYRNLNNFILKQKKQIQKRLLYDTTILKLKGSGQLSKLTFKQFINSNTQLYYSKNITKGSHQKD